MQKLVLQFINRYVFLVILFLSPVIFLSTGCATNTSGMTLEELHTHLTSKEGTAHYDHWSPSSQRIWNRAFVANQ